MATQQEHAKEMQGSIESLSNDPRALSVRYDAATNFVIVELDTGYSISFPPQRSQDLQDATPEDLAEVEMTYPGFGIYFPRIDADLLVPSLAQGRFGSDDGEAAWLAAHPLEERPYPVHRHSEAA